MLKWNENLRHSTRITPAEHRAPNMLVMFTTWPAVTSAKATARMMPATNPTAPAASELRQ